MKKRTLVCFLIFTLCVFYTAIPNTVFGQEEEASVAEQVKEKYGELLQREDLAAVLPQVLEGLKSDQVQNTLSGNPALINVVVANPDILATLGVNLDPEFITLLKEDQAVKDMLSDPLVQSLLADVNAIEEFEALLAVDDGTTPPPEEEVTPPEEEVTPPPEEEVTPPEEEVTPPPEEEVTPPEEGVTPPPEEEVTPPKEEVTPPPEEEVTPPKEEVTPPAVEVPIAPPFESVAPTNLSGKSRLGGLSLNSASSRKFIEDFIAALAPPGITIEAEVLVDAILDVVPKGYLPKNQIRQILLSKRLTAFPLEADYLDSENFGNAITPNFADFLYTDFGEAANQKYLTSDGLHLYTRVPAKVAGVEFSLSDGTTVPGTEVTPEEFQADTIPYTFRLEETLAATNLPAWPSLNAQLFSSVTLRHLDTLMGEYYSVDMQPVSGENGVVWETTLGIPPSGSTYYYFEVVLAEPLTFTALDRDAIAALDPTTVTLADIFNPANLHKIRIDGWAMPDPRNLQLADRGILEKLFTPALATEFQNILTSPQVIDIAVRALAGEQVNINEILSVATPKQLRRIQNILIRNTNALTTQFENEFDPMLASVFSVPRVDLETHSLWTAHIPNIADGNYQLKADVLDAEGTVLDRIQENITVDTSAPEADIGISPSDANTTGYLNDDGIFVATAPTAGTAAMLNIMGMPKAADVGPGQGYLFYQMIGLNEDGTPFLGEPSAQRPNTWMPLTVDSTMLVSNIWDLVREAIAEGQNPPSDPIVQAALALPLSGVLGILNADLLQQFAGPFLKGLEPYIGFSSLSDSQYQLIVDALGATIDIVDHLVPVTFDASDHLVMPIQGENMPLLVGDYGIRAMGIDTLFNVGAYATPTHLRIVAPEYDKASVTFAVIGDCNLDGDMDDLFESGPIGDVTIFKNTTDNVVLTVTVDHRSVHPASVMVQYMDSAGVWQDIGTPLDLDGYGAGSTLTIDWNVADFEDLVMAGNTVSVRAVATNALQLTDLNAVEGTINLDAGICPLDPEVIAITVDPATTTNSESGAPQGMLTLNAYTPSRTSMPINSVRLAAKGPQDVEWTIETSEAAENIGGQMLADLLGDLVNTVGPDKPIANVNSTYQKWVVSIDTTKLMDTITKGSADDNQYVVTGYVNTDGGEQPPVPGVDAKFSVDNIGPTKIDAVATADGAVEANEDGSYTVGGLVDKYDEAVESPMVTFTITPVSYPTTYTSVMVVTDAEGASITEATETAEGSGVFEITVDVGILADGEYLENGTYMFHAVAVDAEGSEVPETDGAKISVNVENTYRPAPEILAITTDPAVDTNPDSGAPKGIVTVNAYSIGEITSPRINSTRFEVKRLNDDDSAWKPVGTAEEGTVVTSEEVQELQHLNVDALSDIIAVAAETAATSSESSPIHRYQAYQKWTVDIDTVALELPDTIEMGSPAERDASKDDNPYVVRAVAISAANEGETVSPDGVTSTFSLDNDDDVAPEGETKIVAVADVASPITKNEDGSYTVGGIVDDTVPSPIAMFTIAQNPELDPITYEGGSVNLVQTTADGTETTTEGEAGILDTITIDVGLLENGTYMFHALTVDESGNVQEDMSETDGSRITVHVLNFRVSDVTDITVIAVDGTDVAEPPAEPIPLRESVTVSFMVANGSLTAEELSGAVNGQDLTGEPPPEEDPENTFSLKVEVGALVDGVYTPDGVVKKGNGSVAFPLTTVNVDNTGPMVTIESPTEDETVDSLPTLRATYHDGAGAGVDGATGSLALARLQPPNEAEVVVDQADLDKDAESLVYTRSEPIAGGAYRVTVQVTDNLGNVGEGSAEFAVNGTAPMVAIHSPASGQTFEHGEPLISGEFSGAGTVKVTTFTINDVEATPEVNGNRFSYTPEEALADGNHTVVVAVTDGDDNTAQTSVTFTVEMPKDTTPPVISEVAPSGSLVLATNGDVITLSAVVFDDQSDVVSVRFRVNDLPFQSVSTPHIKAGEMQIDYLLEPGTHTAEVVAVSEGGTTKHEWTFSLVFDDVKPTITSITPSGTIRGGLPVISASASDDSGVDEMSITVIDSNGEEVEGNTEDDSDEGVEGITRLDFNPEAPLEEGIYTIAVRATDTIGNSATAKGTFTIDFDTAAPIITMASPHQNARFKLKPGEKAPTVSIAYADAESGINVESITLVIEGVDSDYKATPSGTKITLQPGQKSASQVMHPLLVDTNAKPETWAGEYVVRFEVADNADQEGNVSEKNEGAREANRAVHTFSFFLEAAEGPIMAARPLNYPNPFKDSTRISFSLARQATVSIVIYDTTLRPVRVLVDNRVFDAGNYTLKENGSDAIGWDGTSSSGEDLARGIYFCEIIVADGFEPEYAILKLALTR